MPKLPTPTLPAAIVFVENCERRVVVTLDGGDVLRLLDTEPSKDRHPADIIDDYCTKYRDALLPHLAEISRLKRVALSLRPSPNLP